MSAAELREAAEVLVGEWEDSDDDTAEDAATVLVCALLLRESSNYFETLPKPVAGALLAIARLINGGAS